MITPHPALFALVVAALSGACRGEDGPSACADIFAVGEPTNGIVERLSADGFEVCVEPDGSLRPALLNSAQCLGEPSVYFNDYGFGVEDEVWRKYEPGTPGPLDLALCAQDE